VLEGGYHPPALVDSTLATMAALAEHGELAASAPQALTARAAAHIGNYWPL
jgi:hypothetical protein